jgi:signal transduction histidine kinase
MASGAADDEASRVIWLRAAVAATAVAFAVAVTSGAAANTVRPVSTTELALALLVGASFALSGLVAWQIRPDNRIGPAMIVTSYLWSISQLYRSQDPLLFTIGDLFEMTYLGAIVYVLLAFPSGRLEGAAVRGLAFVVLLLTVPFEALHELLQGTANEPCAGCPQLILQLADAPELSTLLHSIHQVSGAVAAAAATVIVARRWYGATAALRFAITPVIWTGVGMCAVLALWIVNATLGGPRAGVVDAVMDLMLAAVPVSFLIGVARTRLARSAVAELMIELSGTLVPGALQVALARALHDPSLAIAYWLPDEERFVDAAGADVELPTGDDDRAVTMVERTGQRIAALIHDAAVDDEPLIRSACAAAGLALENVRLQADLRAQLAEVRSSRARIIEATENERRRIERDLHDGTQQRLVSIAMTLGLAEAKAGDQSAVRELIAESRAAMSSALNELRELSRGIHPGILTDRGLAPALDDLVMRLRMPVEVDVALTERLPARVESTAYYLVSEGLTNVAKYAHATRAHVRVTRENGAALVEISDDGAGGADPAKGTGLRGLRDRVEALGGRFAIASSQGHGTTIRAELPCV